MPGLIAAIFLGLLCGGAAFSAPPAGYKLAWADEFDGTSVNQAKWAYRTDSKLWSTQTPANVSVTNGSLVISLKKEKAEGKEYTGGGVISKQAFLYGYYESRFRILAGKGWHSSFWMQRSDGSGGTGPGAATLELDVIENDSINLNSYGVDTHRWEGQHASYGGKHIETPSLAEFHVYGCEYTASTVNYFFDGQVVQSVDISQVPQGGLNIWLTSIAAPLGKTDSVDDAKLPGRVEYDYVRYYKKP